MVKVMISMPDEFLAQELTQKDRQRRTRIEEMLDAATGKFGGDGTKLIREDRESH
jgi:hypothetical protein